MEDGRSDGQGGGQHAERADQRDSPQAPGGHPSARQAVRLSAVNIQLLSPRKAVKLHGLRYGVNSTRSVDEGSRRGRLRVALATPPGGTLHAQEPDRVVRKLDFVGNVSILDETLAAAISTTESSWFARNFFVRWLGLGEKRYFNEEEFRRDVIRLHVLYRRSGFPNAKVDTAVVREPENVYITFRIQEGDPMVVTNLAGQRPRLASRVAPAHRGAGPPAAGGRPVQPVPDAGQRRLDRAAAAATAATPPRASSPDSRPTGPSWWRG